MKNILHLSYSKSGGAGRVAQTLSTSQVNLPDYNSDFIFKIRNDLWSNPTQDSRSSVTAAVDNFLVKKPTFQPLFSLYREKTDKKFYEIIRKHNGILHFHWMNGLIDFTDSLKSEIMDKPLVWTIHDMNPLTGGCHHALFCRGHEKSCKACPAVRGIFRNKVFEMKAVRDQFFRIKENIRIVVPSDWLADKVIASENFEGKRVNVIPNPIDPIFFQDLDKSKMRKKLNLPLDAFIVGFVSQNLNNPLKGLDLLVKLLNCANFSLKKEVIFLGIGKLNEHIRKANFRVIATGVISDSKRLVENYAVIDVMVSTSLAETFGLSILESAALGIPSLVMSGSATEELVVDLSTGYIAKSHDAFVDRLVELSEDKILRDTLGKNARLIAWEEFNIKKIIKQYNQVYESF